mgnify:CR=1 FL=1
MMNGKRRIQSEVRRILSHSSRISLISDYLIAAKTEISSLPTSDLKKPSSLALLMSLRGCPRGKLDVSSPASMAL